MFFERLQSLCNRDNTDVSGVLKALGLSTSKGTAWKGGSFPRADVLLKLANYFNVSTDYLLGLTDDPSPAKQREKAASGLSKSDQEQREKYYSLDLYGKEAVKSILDIEYRRMEAAKATQDRNKVEIASEITTEPVKIIPLFVSASAAGIASPILGEDYEDYTLQKGDPQRAIMAIRVQGDSMEPYFPDGSIVFCDKTPMQVGDIGVFILDGGSLLKQWCPDNYGNAYLFSLNRKRADADVTVWSTSNQNLTCMGRVITSKRFPLPMA